MGGMNSGRRDQGGKKITEDCRSLDVRKLQRDGLLDNGKSFDWNWTCNGEKMASIQLKVGENRVTLDYKHQSNGNECGRARRRGHGCVSNFLPSSTNVASLTSRLRRV